MLSPLIKNNITKIKSITPDYAIENHQFIYKLYDLTPEEIKIVEEFNEGK